MSDHDLHISKRLKAILPPLTAKEKKQLEANLLADGRVIDPVLYWHDGKRDVIVDGMHRHPLAEKHGLSYGVERVLADATTYEEAGEWIWDHFVGRRNLSREAMGKWYNQLKTSRGGDRKSKEIKGTNDPLIDSAEHIAEKTGKSAKTVKRAGKRADTLEGCAPVIQRAVGSGTMKASDADLKTLAKLPKGDQQTIATAIRKKRAKSVREAMKLEGIKAPAAKPSKPKPPKRLDKKAYYQQWDQAIGKLLRLVDRIADGVGEKHGGSHDAVHDHLNNATDAMVEWMGVK